MSVFVGADVDDLREMPRGEALPEAESVDEELPGELGTIVTSIFEFEDTSVFAAAPCDGGLGGRLRLISIERDKCVGEMI